METECDKDIDFPFEVQDNCFLLGPHVTGIVHQLPGVWKRRRHC